MNQELIDMARKAGLKVTSDNEILPSYLGSVSDGYFKLAKLVAADEREACAKLADEYATWGGSNFFDWFKKLSAAIRARGEKK